MIEPRIDPNNLISNPIRTSRAILVYERVDNNANRIMNLCGELWDQNGEKLFKYYDEKNGLPFFGSDKDSLPNDGALSHVSIEYISMPFGRKQNRTNAIDILAHRMVPAKRTDYEEYLNEHGISKSNNLDKLSLLAYTKAKLTRDSFAVYDTLDGFEGKFRYIFETLNHKPKQNLKINDKVTFLQDENPNKVKIVLGEDPDNILGYVNQLQAGKVLEWLKSGNIQARVFMYIPIDTMYPTLFICADIDTGNNT